MSGLPMYTAKRPLVLVIDDSVTVRRVATVALQRAGFAVRSFPDGPAALRWLVGPDAEQPVLIYLDIGMPKMDGYEVASALRRLPKLKQTQLVMLSCRDGLLDRLKGRLAGAQEYLINPFRTEHFVALARMAFRNGIVTVLPF